jgi:hypothetical protein
MTRLIISGFVAAFFAAAMFPPEPASAGPAGITKPAAESALVKEAGWRDRRRRTVVNAPTTSVRTDDANTDVDAPFTTVRKSPRGTWIRAPFVNLWVPRD